MAEVARTAAKGGLMWPAAACALGGVLGLGFGFGQEPKRAAFAYLVAFAYAVSLSVGSLFVLMIGYAVNAAWMSVLRRVCEAVALGVIPLALLFIPLALCLEHLYVWADPPAGLPSELSARIHHQQAYLNRGAFVARGGGYFVVWIACALLLRIWSRRRERAASLAPTTPRSLARERGFACALLPLVSLAITFAAFDWLMSLTPAWFSSAFGIYYFAGGFVGALALISVLAQRGVRRGELREVVTGHHFHALGRMVFAFTIFWAYVAYFQVFLISIADKPGEVTFYLARLQGGFRALSYLLMVGHFALPVLLLFPKRVKFSGRYVALLSGWLLAMHWVDLYWLVVPAFQPTRAVPSWLDLAALLAVGGATACFCSLVQRGVPWVSGGDPLLEAGIRYASNQ